MDYLAIAQKRFAEYFLEYQKEDRKTDRKAWLYARLCAYEEILTDFGMSETQLADLRFKLKL